jgi:1-acyl-sn-glycerol-3-phosphate acyltransferase
MFNRIISWLFIAFIGVTCAILYLVALAIWLLTVLFDRRLVILHWFTCLWGSIYIWVMPAWSVKVTGREKIPRRGSRVIVSNHQSQLDILVCFTLFFHYKWVSKIEMFKVPFIGWNMTLNRYIRLKRGDKESILQMLADAEKALNQGSSVFFFPEGTRSWDGQVKPFKPGAFHLAKKLQKPILPIAINGTTHALPKKSMNFHGWHKIHVTILDEIPYAEFADLSDEQTGEMVRARIIPHVKEHKP